MDPQAQQAARRGAERRGLDAETRAAAALEARGWTVLARRARTPHGELDLVAERQGLLAFIEVKARADLSEAAFSLSARQQARIMAAAEVWMAANPGHGTEGVRFDAIFVAPGGMRRVRDAFRLWG